MSWSMNCPHWVNMVVNWESSLLSSNITWSDTSLAEGKGYSLEDSLGVIMSEVQNSSIRQCEILEISLNHNIINE